MKSAFPLLPFDAQTLTAEDLSIIAQVGKAIKPIARRLGIYLANFAAAEAIRRRDQVGEADRPVFPQIDILAWTRDDVADALKGVFTVLQRPEGIPWTEPTRQLFRAVSAAVLSAGMIAIRVLPPSPGAAPEGVAPVPVQSPRDLSLN